MFKFENLDDATRSSMLEAIEEGESTGNIYHSTRFNQDGNDQWLTLLKQAAQKFNEHWLAYQLESNGLMKDSESAVKLSGGYTTKHVPHTASETIAEGQFNRFYILGLCKRARAEGITHLEIYRAKERFDPRPESQALIGTLLSIDEVESQLTLTNASFKSQLVKPNSGLCVKSPPF
jgi:hypothetical protein